MTEPALPIIEKLTRERRRETATLEGARNGERLPLPLASQRIVARVAECVAEVTVEQSFQNPFQETLEAVYIFPLGGSAAVSSFEMKAGDRALKGIVKERSQARLDYSKALDEGKRAALLEQERDNVFTVQVGNLPPGEAISVRIVYSERLTYFEDGATELRLPLVVAPRYIPGEPLDGVSVGAGVDLDTDVVPDASRISPPRLAPGFDPKVALSIEVELAGGEVSDIACSQHAVKIANRRIALSRSDEPLNRDFVLRWRLAKTGIQSRFLVNRGGYGMLSLIPPKQDGSPAIPRDVVFVLDRSGSMGGVKMASAARACSILLATLSPHDNFAVCAFDNSTEWMQWTAADEAGIAAGAKFLRGIGARGGTEIDPALAEAFTQIRARQESFQRLPVIVLITDGQVGNEAQVLKHAKRDLGATRIFTVGIDTAVNEPFLQRLSAVGGGTCTSCAPGEALDDALTLVGRQIGTPLVTGLRIEGGDLAAPSHAPDLFAGRSSTCFLVGKNLKQVRVHGTRADGTAFDATVKAEEIELPGIEHLWARARVADLEDRFRLGENVKQEIIDLAVKHTLLTRFTAFVVVDESEPVNREGKYRTVVQPVEMPERWESQQLVFGQTADVQSSPVFQGRIGTTACAQSANDILIRKVVTKLAHKAFRPGRSAEDLSGAGKLLSPLSADERDKINRAIAMLARVLRDVRAALEHGTVPASAPVKEAADALRQALQQAARPFSKLLQFLRTTLDELIRALDGGSAASALPILERAQKEFEAAARRQNFWEAGV
jgi:Ca-activated chloride channel family protein